MNERDFILRDFVPEDYEAIAAVMSAAFPDYPATAEEIRHNDRSRGARSRFRRWVVESGGAVVGEGGYGQRAQAFHPHRFSVDFSVLPGHRRRGIGSALLDAILRGVEEHEPITLDAQVREDMEGNAFLRRRGFEEVQRTWESRLDPQTFDFAAWKEREEQVIRQGIRLASFRELASDPDHPRKAHELHNILMRDVPLAIPATETTLEEWTERVRDDPNLLPDAYLLALDGDRYVGETALWSSQGQDHLYVGLTGVLREYRNRGIALALKLRTLAWARDRGARVVKTWNEMNNEPILRMNERLGFVKQPAWLTLRKVVREEAGERVDSAG